MRWKGAEPRIVVQVLEERVTCGDVEQKSAGIGIDPHDTTVYPERHALEIVMPWPARAGDAWPLEAGQASASFEFDQPGESQLVGASGRLEVVRIDADVLTLRVRAQGSDGALEGQIDVMRCL
jgi:hypothetical protein